MSILFRMLELLTGAYRKTDEHNVRVGLPLESNIGKLFSVFGWGLGVIEDNAEHVRLWADIDNARGAVLDRYGANFGVARGGASDVFYRLMIKIKILAQLSGGDIETIIEAVAGLYQIDAASVELYEIFPAKVQVAIYEEDLPAGYDGIKDLVGQLTKRLLAAGVGIDMVYKIEETLTGRLFIGGRPVAEFTRMRLENRILGIPELSGPLFIGGRAAAEHTRIRLENRSEDLPEIQGTLLAGGLVAAEASRIRLESDTI